MPGEPVAAGIVGDLLGAETTHQGGVDVDVGRTTGAERRQQPDIPVDEPFGERIRRGRGLETRDGPLEQQLLTRQILDREIENSPGESNELLPGRSAGGGLVELGQQLFVGLRVHQVVEVELRGDVYVQRRLPDADPAGHLVQRDRSKPGLGDDVHAAVKISSRRWTRRSVTEVATTTPI